MGRASEYVYFVRAAESGMIKIGRAADPQQRLGALQTSTRELLTIVRLERSDDAKARERELHDHFRQERVRGEWFRPSRALLKMLGGIDRFTPEERRRLSESADEKVRRWREQGATF